MPPENANVGDRPPALDDLRLALVPLEVVSHNRVDSLEEAAKLRGVKPSAVIKTMVVRRSANDYFFVLVPGDRMINWPKLRELLESPRLSMPEAEEAFAATGYVRGSITPFAAERDWPVIADAAVGPGDVSIGAGAPGKSLTIDSAQLIEILEARVADVTRPIKDG